MTNAASTPAKKRSHSQSEAAGENRQLEDRRLESLPLEIRNEIYHESLISDSCIDVSTLRCHAEFKDNIKQVYFNPDPKATSQSLKDLNVNLLKASPQIAEEASKVFYSRNKFAFHSHRDWTVVVDWLKSIGSENLKHVTNVEIDVRQLNRVYQYEDGHRESYIDQEINRRHPLLQRSNDSTWPEGEVDDIDPKMENVFSTLANCDYGSKLRLDICYIGGGYPGCFEDPTAMDEINEHD